MNPTMIYHGAWLAFSILAIILGAVNILEEGFELFSALLVVIGLLFGARSVQGLFLSDDPAEVESWQAYLAVLILLVMLFVLASEWIL